MNSCPACGGERPEVFLRRSAVPVHQNLLCASAAAARSVARGDIELALCVDCGLVFNAAFDARKLSYEEGYDSNQSQSAAFMAHVDALVERLLAAGVRGRRVVEVGCGSGYFLRRLCARGENQGVGYDPGYRGPAHDAQSGASFVRAFFAPAAAPDTEVLVCRHVVEHVPRPVEFVRQLTSGLELAGCYFETPSFEWIVAQAAVWDVFYEHCNYFTARGLDNVFRSAGLTPASLERVFGGQYFWVEARRAGAGPRAEEPSLDGLALFGRRCAAEQRRQAALLEKLAERGTVVVWGAAAKGATYANLLDPAAELIRCLTDINPARQGRFVPGSGHEILPPTALPALDVSDVIVMNPNYTDEIRDQLAALGLTPQIRPAAFLRTGAPRAEP